MPDKLETYSIKESLSVQEGPRPHPTRTRVTQRAVWGLLFILLYVLVISISYQQTLAPKRHRKKGRVWPRCRTPGAGCRHSLWLSQASLGTRASFRAGAFCSCSQGGDNLTQGGDAEQIWFGQSLREAMLCRVYTLGALLALL